MNQRGFTLVELLIVIGIFVLTVTVSGIFTSVSKNNRDLNDVSVQMVDTLRRARHQTITGNQDVVWGIHFETDRYVLFQGDTYSSVDPENIEFVLPGSVQISAISLTGGGSEVIFDDKFGNTSTDGTITLQSTNATTTTQIIINSAGLIED